MRTKIWQICRVLRETGLKETDLASAISGNAELASLIAKLNDYDNVSVQDRFFFDANIDDGAIETVLSKSKFVFFSSPSQVDANTLVVRANRESGKDQEISATTAFRLLGGARLEEVFESGSASVSSKVIS